MKKFNRSDLQVFLEKHNIQTRPIFSGNILRHPAFSKLESASNVDKYVSSDYIMRNGILIGCHQGLKIENLKYIHRTINHFLKKQPIRMKISVVCCYYNEFDLLKKNYIHH